MSLKRVFEPLTIRGCEIPNRISRSAHATSLHHYGAITDRLIDYHVARAKGGVGLTFLEGTAVHPTSASSLANYDDSVIPSYARLMAAIRPHGMRVFQQIVHTGHMYPLSTQLPPWGVSAVPSPMTGLVASPIGQEEIDTIIAAFAAAALRCRKGGIEGVEIHGAHGYLIMQFLSPLVNTRTDRYGGSLENRMRFLRELLIAVRKAVGDDYPLGVRLGASIAQGSIGTDELAEVVRLLEAENLIDFINASWTDYYEFRFIAAMDQPTGYQVPNSAKLTTAAVKAARFVVGRFRTLEEAEQVLRDDVADMVHMTRAHIADPDIVRKTRAGHPERVRACIACNQACWHGTSTGWPLACTINPAAGMEGTLNEDLIVPAHKPKRVLVIGGGPAGMEAARVARLCGHHVTLAEAGPDLGGQLTVARRAPFLHTIGDIAFWLEQEIYRLGVEVRTNSYFDVADVLAHQPDHVVIATGAVPRGNGLQYGAPHAPIKGYDLPHVISAEELLTSPDRKLGQHALVFDDVGHYEALAAAEYLIDQGAAVTFATRYGSIGPQLDPLSRVDPAMRRFAAKGRFTPMLRARVEAIEPGRARVRALYQSEAAEVPADTVVLITAREPMRDVYDGLRASGFRLGENLVIVGDAHAPRDLQFAIAEGHRMVRAMV
jgi:2,4-dienoyl-CoA reductase-like NADH-dependent reductase (Old Yellow Enzyme family)/pyruvate/2-oxoglutarate dehydrogenase complex dihydrolipoamide dehydrogenase (E3) component